VNNQINTVKGNGLGLTQQLSIALNNQDGIKDQIKNAQGNIEIITAHLNTQTQTCNQANQIIAGLRNNITALQGTILGVDQKINGIDNQIGDYNAQIANLQKQIDDLQKKIAQAKNDKQNLINLNYTVPQQIANLNSQITIQQASCSSDNGGYTNADLAAAQNKLAGLQGQLTDSSNIIVNINTNISLAKAQLTDLFNKSALLTQNINKIQGNINSLKQQLPLE
jgi:chromosome segregation ATPase